MQRTVYVPNLPMRHDAATNKLVPARDINAAANFGHIQIITRGSQRPSQLGDAMRAAREAAEQSQPQDLIVAIGDVLVLAAMVVGMWSTHGTATLLRWDKRVQSYRMIQTNKETPDAAT